jgi:3-oxoacyl-[acyl-carrier protein] reductase
MILKNRNAVIYGGSGSLGSAVAKALARDGAHVVLTGRTISSLKKVQDEIIYKGGTATVAVVDALDEKAVRSHIAEMAESLGSVDITFNAIDTRDVQDKPLAEMPLEEFIRPINISMTTQFITTTAAAHVMMKQRRGVILSLTATPGGIGYPGVGGFGPMCCAVEGLSRNLAAELGPYGIRVVNIRSGGSPDSRPFLEAIQHLGSEANMIITSLEGDTMLKTLPLMEDIGNVAAFLASDRAGKITGVTIDVTCGTTSALNHKTDTIPFGSF